jgi:hypothetical protein
MHFAPSGLARQHRVEEGEEFAGLGSVDPLAPARGGKYFDTGLYPVSGIGSKPPRSAVRRDTMESGSLKSPKCRAWVGQVATHAGWRSSGGRFSL